MCSRICMKNIGILFIFLQSTNSEGRQLYWCFKYWFRFYEITVEFLKIALILTLTSCSDGNKNTRTYILIHDVHMLLHKYWSNNRSSKQQIVNEIFKKKPFNTPDFFTILKSIKKTIRHSVKFNLHRNINYLTIKLNISFTFFQFYLFFKDFFCFNKTENFLFIRFSN